MRYLAFLYNAIGDYAKAEEYYLELIQKDSNILVYFKNL